MKRGLGRIILLSLPLYLFLCMGWACAADQTGSLTVAVKGDQPASELSVTLYRVGNLDGSLANPFADADIPSDALLDPQNHSATVGILANYIAQHHIEGITNVTNSAGQAMFQNLSHGVYLVTCQAGQPYTFSPFLVQIPAVISDSPPVYDVISQPKIEAVPSQVPDDPSLPQTGVNRRPVFLFCGLGTLLLAGGLLDLCLNRRNPRE